MATEENGGISHLIHSQSGRTQLSLIQPIAGNTHEIEITQMEVSIEIDENEVLASSMSEKLKSISGNPGECEPVTIFRVPEYIREKNKELYEPQIVSIGPYHHGAKRLQAMEERKWKYLRDLLCRSGESYNLISLVKEMRFSENEARRAYSESFSLSSDEFVKMMVLDGCFIIEFLVRSYFGDQNAMWVNSIWHSDLFLLENQIPFFIISRLHSILRLQVHYHDRLSLDNILSDFMFNDPIKKLNLTNNSLIYHLIHLHYYCYVPQWASTKGRNNLPTVSSRCFDYLIKYLTSRRTELMLTTKCFLKLTTSQHQKVIPCASSLREAGVKFKRKKSPDNMFHVTFENGILEIPSVLIDNNRKRLLLNLVAFEQSDISLQKNLTSFAMLMDMLIDTPSDVAILEQSDILHNMLSSAEEATCFFNRICECATLDYDNNYLTDLFWAVRNYCDSRWHRNRARLVRDYFYNPWAIISLIAAIFLLIFSFTQSFFSVFAYFIPPH